ncbi:MAG: FtsX-like permease family protein [Bacteroidota bacterium]
MLRSYWVLVWRHVARHKATVTVNVVGLAVGMAACAILALYIHHELRYDQFHEAADELYQVYLMDGDGGMIGWNLPEPVGPVLQDNVPAVDAMARVTQPYEVLIEADGRQLYDAGLITADSTFFDLFSHATRLGNLRTALRPGTIVLTQTAALKFFGERSPLGATLRTLSFDTTLYEVTAVIDDPPTTTSLPFSMVAFRPEIGGNSWGSRMVNTYVRLNDSAQLPNVLDALPPLVERQVEAGLGSGETAPELALGLLPMAQVHLNPDPTVASSPQRRLGVLGFAALLLLLIACINYVNLTTAQGVRRMREVGVRKAVGAYQDQLMRQFLGESVVTTIAAAGIAGVLVVAAVPAFANVVQVPLTATAFMDPAWLTAIVLATLAVGLLSGLYPALILARIQPSVLLKGQAAGHRKAALRHSLVVVQLIASITLVIAAVVVYKQLSYVQTQHLNVRGDQVVVVKQAFRMEGYSAFRSDLLAQPSVAQVTTASMPGRVWASATFRNDDGADQRLAMMSVGEGYLETLGLSLVAGSPFGDQQGIIVNETAVARFEVADPVVGEKLKPGLRNAILGVVEDYHLESFREEILPLQLQYRPDDAQSTVLVRLKEGQVAEGLSAIDAVWQQYMNKPPLFEFLDDILNASYTADQRMGKLFSWFAVLASLVACLGLLGLVAFSTARRQREVSIRKVLGATTGDIVGLMTRDYAALVAIAFAIGAPLAFIGLQRWLDSFAYRIEVSVLLFTGVGFSALALVLLTVSIHVVRVALKNPVESLRHE